MILTKVPQIDLAVENKKVYLEPTHAHFTKKIVTSSSGTTNFGSLTFVAPAPSRTTFTDRRVRFTGTIKAEFTGTVAGSDTQLLNIDRDAPRAYPLQSILQTVTINIDNQSYTFLPSKLIHPLSHYFKRTNDAYDATYLDKYAYYEDGKGKINNPLSGYGNSSDHNQPRGGTNWRIVANTGTTATVLLYINEMLFIPPFTNHFDQQLGMTNYSNMDFNFLFTTGTDSGGRFWSHCVNGAPGATSTITETKLSWVGTQPTLMVDYYNNAADYIPKTLTYKTDLFSFQTTQVSEIAYIAPNDTGFVASSVLTANTYQFSVIPNKLYIFVQKYDATKTMTDTDTYLPITGISLTFGNVTGILSSADSHTLYMMSRKNGLIDSYPEWVGAVAKPVGGAPASPFMTPTVGSVLCLEMGSDIPLSYGYYPGQPGSFNFQISELSVQNNRFDGTTGQNLNGYYIYCIYQVDSYTHMGDAIIRESGLSSIPTEEEKLHPIAYNSIKNYYGAGLSDKFNQILPYLKKANQWLKDYKIISTLASTVNNPIAHTVADVADKWGYGHGGRMITAREMKKRLDTM